jgi:hypothetical protein
MAFTGYRRNCWCILDWVQFVDTTDQRWCFERCGRTRRCHQDANESDAGDYGHRGDGETGERRRRRLVVDATFMTPYLQPIRAWARAVVVHSMTKYMNWHNDATGGAVVLTQPEDTGRFKHAAVGGGQGQRRWIASRYRAG